MKIVIIGGGAAGASVAARARRLNESAQILLFEKNAEVSQATCGMPYHLGEVISDRERLVVVSPEEFSTVLNVDVYTQTEVVAIDRINKTITVQNLRTDKVWFESYDKLVLGTGASAVLPKIDGAEHANVFTLNKLDDMDAIKKHLKEKDCHDAVIVGGGFIGLEVAENLHRLGIKVSIVELANQVMAPLDYEMASLVHQHLAAKNIQLLLGNAVTAFTASGVRLNNGELIKSGLTIVAIGVKPQTQLASQLGLEIGEFGGIRTNDRLQTSDENIYALGDVVEITGHVEHSKTLVPLAGPAHKQAAVVADNITGGYSQSQAVLATGIAKVFDLTVAATGNNEKDLRRKRIPYQTCTIDMPAHAGYYPDAAPLCIKLLFTPDTGRILGAQVVGSEGVDKRIDVLSVALQFDKTVFDLARLELAYAPPFSSAKDPVNVAGMVAQNILNGEQQVVHWHEVEQLQKEGVLFVDVRSPDEYELGSIKDSLHIPLEMLRSRLKELTRDKKIVLYCQLGKKGYFAWRILTQNGFNNVVNLNGGFRIYQYATQRLVYQAGVDQQRVSSTATKEHDQLDIEIDLDIDATGLGCPGPIMKLNKGIKTVNCGRYLLIKATDPGFPNDIQTWCGKTGHGLFSCSTSKSVTTVVIRKKDQH